MITKFKAHHPSCTIKKYRISGETDKYIYFKWNNLNCRQEKTTDSHKWFDNFNDAKEYLIKHQIKRISKAKEALEYTDMILNNIEELKEIDFHQINKTISGLRTFHDKDFIL